jgi:hypothetical protein
MGLFASLEQALGRLAWLRPFRRWFPICVFVAGSIIWSIKIAHWGDFGVFLILLLVYPITIVILLVLAALHWRQWHYGLPALLIFLLLSWVIERDGYIVRAEFRWLAGSDTYKSELFAGQPASAGELRHIDWDGWGMAGQDTEAYLVFDPKNSLADAARHKVSGKVSGIPCPVWYVRRLEDHWYYAMFYTNTVWEYCGDSQ